ncbi:hydrogenase small subunit [Granulicella sp. 5B5]|uniref:hydrogenase small subunit n=1 Tax=Granulicella sp. 5B5 TaxID=1617967 RepID=UPI0015F67CF4|nr:hydrogenase small subunit [Granulicella sp. 5B5]QMV19882.1 hydrogenase small subunit [Granulicella sp. 5B5]
MNALPEIELRSALEARGISRRQFVKFCSTMVATLALPPRYLHAVVKALDQTTRPVLVWLEFQDCAGNSESMLRSGYPSVGDFVLELLSWEYHELIMAGAGKRAEETLERVMRDHKGEYIAVIEGSIPMAEDGVHCTIGGKTALDIATRVCSNAAINIAVGACAWDGGIVRASPNPTGAVGLAEAVPGIKNLVNLGGCPHNPANTAAVLVHYLTFHDLPALDQYHRPLFAYGDIIHDQCERRAHYDAGRYVEEWGDEGHRKGWCLYKMGCKGPEATYNCPTVRWNEGTSWPVKAGHGCIACASPRFWDTKSPFYDRLPKVPGFGVDVLAEEIGWGGTAAVGIAMLAQVAGNIVRDKTRAKNVRAEENPPPDLNAGGSA